MNDHKVVTIKEFSDPSVFNLGLEKYGLAKWEGTSTVLDIPFANGKYKLDHIPPEELQEYEDFYGVKFDSPEGKEFLANFQIRLESGFTAFDLSNVDQRFKKRVIDGFKTLVAPDWETANNPMSRYKFYIADEENETNSRITKKEILYEAGSALLKLKNESPKYLVALAKYILPATAGIGDSAILAFDKLDKYINNELDSQTAKYQNAKTFVNALSLDKAHVYVTIDAKAAVMKNIIRRDSEGWYYNAASGTKYGKNQQEIVDFLLNPKNTDELGTGAEADNPYSIRFQLKNV